MQKILKNKILLIVLAIIILGGLFVILRPEPSMTNQQTTEQNTTQPSSQSPVTRTFSLKIEESQVTGDITMQVIQGDTVVINLSSDESDELHLHGYDKEVELKAGAPEKLTFTADQTGRFEIELHELDQVIAALEVQPRP